MAPGDLMVQRYFKILLLEIMGRAQAGEVVGTSRDDRRSTPTFIRVEQNRYNRQFFCFHLIIDLISIVFDHLGLYSLDL